MKNKRPVIFNMVEFCYTALRRLPCRVYDNEKSEKTNWFRVYLYQVY